MWGVVLPGEAPVRPGPDEARRLLESELSRPEYQEHPSLVERLLAWLYHLLGGTGVPSVPVGAAVVIGVLVVVAALVVWRLRDVRQVTARRRREAGLADPARTAEDYRADARRELTTGAFDRAAVAAFRALVVDLDDADVVHDAPGRTASEVARAAGAALPGAADEMHWASSAFDAARYGHADGTPPGADADQRLTAADVDRLLAIVVPRRAVRQEVPA